MLGAIIGDIIGSTYEFQNTRNYDFELFPNGSSFTDDSICTIAIADTILKHNSYKDSLHEWCRKYPDPKGAYGGMFAQWIDADDPKPYNSFGNGAAMRVSPVGWAFANPKDVMEEAKKSAECSHNHPEGIKGAQAIALSINYLITNRKMDDVRQMIDVVGCSMYGDEYAKHLPAPGEWDGTCQGCVPLAIHLFLKSKDFEDAIRLAISYGGDSDTMGAIVGALAEAAYGVPEEIGKKAMGYLPKEMVEVINEFDEKYNRTNK